MGEARSAGSILDPPATFRSHGAKPHSQATPIGCRKHIDAVEKLPSSQVNMFSRPKSFSDFFIKSLKTIPYVAALNGLIFFLAGIALFYTSYDFENNSSEAQLRVVKMEKQDGDNRVVYLPHFEALRSDGVTIRYAGNLSSNPKLHEEGDIVDGRVNWATGEMRSVELIDLGKRMGILVAAIGILSILFGGIYHARHRILAFFTSRNPG